MVEVLKTLWQVGEPLTEDQLEAAINTAAERDRLLVSNAELVAALATVLYEDVWPLSIEAYHKASAVVVNAKATKDTADG